MSAETASNPGRSEPYWSAHARENWYNPRRNDVDERDHLDAWDESTPVDYPDAYDGARGRYHAEGDCVLIVKTGIVRGQRRPVIKTVINLQDRPAWEQEYVRCQAAHARSDRR